MPEANIIKEHMEVIDCDGERVGTVKELDGDCIKLTGASSGDGQIHFIISSLVQDIRGNCVTLTATGAQALGASETSWQDNLEKPGAGD